jgi:3-oxoacyl-[acyl-carrier-protein] synthase-3
VTLDQIAFVATTTPTAWFAEFVAAALPIPRSRTLSVFARYANVGPVLVPASLAHAAKTERIRKGDLVLCFAIGSVSSAAALVMRWGDVAVAPLPAGGNSEVR